MKETQTTYELFYTSEIDSWEPAAEAYWTREEAEKALIRLKEIEPSACIVRTVRTKLQMQTVRNKEGRNERASRQTVQG